MHSTLRTGRRGAALALAASVAAALLVVTPSAAAEEDPVAAASELPVHRAVNLNGPAVTAAGIEFEAGTAPGVTAGPKKVCNQAVALIPPVDDDGLATMLRCAVWGSGNPGTQVSLADVPAGDYEVSVYVWEDNSSASFTLYVEGQKVAKVVSGPGGTWQELGPYPVTVSDGSLDILTTGGSGNLSGVVVRGGTGAPPPPVNTAPTVTSPGAQTSTVGTAIAPLQVQASDPDAGQTLTYAASGLPAGLAIHPGTGVISGTPTAAGVFTVTVSATDDGTPPASGSTGFSWTVQPASDPDPDPDPGPGPVEGLYRAVNLNGPAITVGGVDFEAGTAPGVTAGPKKVCNQNVALLPPTDDLALATMLRCAVWGSGNPGTQVSLADVPTGTYQVSVYVWEDNSSQTFTLYVEGQKVAKVVSGPGGTWQELGPYPVTVSDGSLDILTTGGSGNLSGVVVRGGTGAPPPPVNTAPTVTSPGAQTSTVGAAIDPVQVQASDPDAGQTLTYAASGLPAGLAIDPATGVVSGTPTAAGAFSVTVTVTDDGAPPRSASVTFAWTVEAAEEPDPDPEPVEGLYRAVNLNGPALTAAGVDFEAGTAPGVTAGPRSVCNQGVPLVPPTEDVGLATMLRCAVWGSGNPGTQVAIADVPTGTYQVSVYVWEDNSSQTFTLYVEGQKVAKVVSGPGGTWQLVGPFTVAVTDGTLNIHTTGGSGNLSGVVVTSGTGTPPPPVNVAPTVTSPGAQTSTVGAAIDPVQVQASDPDVGQTLTYAASGLPAGLTIDPATGVISGTPTATGTFSVTVTVTDDGTPPRSASTTFTWTVTTGGGTGPVTFDPTKVTDTFIAGGWTRVVSADWLPDGTMLVLSQRGIVYRVNPATGAQSVELDIQSKVFSQDEAGSLDILVDPTGTGYWIYYTAANSDRLRISHFTLGSSAEQVVWENPGLGYNASHAVHLGGSLNLGPDGKLYLTVGDRYESRSQDLTNVYGKVLRINTDGTVPTDNPFYDGPGPNVDEIWAYGLRNPYRANFDPATGFFWVGDVGGNTDTRAYEEVNLIEPGRNYGWPMCEGPVSGPKNGPECPAGVTGPVHYYSHEIGAGCCQNRAIVGGEVYHGDKFPLAGYYVYSDYAIDTFTWVQLAADGRTEVASGLLTTVSSAVPVWLGVGPDGNIYWLSLGWSGNGQLRRLTYSGPVGSPPVVTTASATPTVGAGPLTVAFTGAAHDPDGTPVSYLWEFGDGTTSTAQNPTHTYADGTYQAILRVTSGGQTTSSDPITIVVGSPPVATITSPADGAVFRAGETITITGSATDPDTGPLPGSALSWDVQFLHNEHGHPVATGTGSSIQVTVPTTGHDFAGNTRYRITLTATDPDGLQGTTEIILWPDKVGVPISSPTATTVTVDGITQNLPHTVDTVIGFQHEISVPATQCVVGRLWQFQSWNDGGARVHTITVAAGMNLVATYVETGACPG